ncbi:RNA polymerase, sigma-24 subunit, ECF subfamily [Mizugakiibacter sediminis]|uniref:RNA polymerase, sigma-24 subunit, ECF subfamily n=2 Tax=Mizugakiibacter sediminis TaxID=1475481 RepID=A0A0K8QJR1_9GAMM|nr:RNA polymerase, sigma-24 subunit, ECF subfamily [Mizugakiibacter sediminis]
MHHDAEFDRSPKAAATAGSSGGDGPAPRAAGYSPHRVGGEVAMQRSETPVPREAGTVPDAELVARVCRGDLGAYGTIMRRYNRRLYRAARGILAHDGDAEDAVQDAYVAAYYKLHTFAEPHDLGAWLTRIAVNEACMKLRKRRPQTSLDEDGSGREPLHTHHGADPAGHAEAEQARRLLEAAIDRLPDAFRAVFVLRALEQMDVAETAACLQLNEATVKTRYHRARNLLRADLLARLSVDSVDAFAFDGARCDRIVQRVGARLTATHGPPNA